MTGDARKDGSERTRDFAALAPSIHVDTSELTTREGHATWADALLSTYCEMGLEWGDAGAHFDAELIGRPFGDLYVSTVRADPHTVVRTPAMIDADRDSDFLLCVVVRGHGSLRQDGRVTDIDDGSFALLDPARPFTFEAPTEFEQLVVRTPRRLLAARLPERAIDTVSAQRVSARTGAGRVVSHLLQEIAGLDSSVAPATASSLAESTMDMLVTALAAESVLRGTTEQAHFHDLRRAQQLIESQMHDPDCSIPDVARSLGFSVRHLQNLFRQNGTTPVHWLYAARLDRARKLLLESDVTVGDVGALVGFRDASHFSRTFRRRFGSSPGEYRKTHLRR
ncbi:MAG: helix-turn-helix domain-containing protein [Rhodococcus sp. (in: high G+C Gram-positive bacteria)]